MPADEQAALHSRVLALGCAPLVDAMGRTHPHRAHLPALSSPDPDRVLFGPVVTVQFLPTRGDVGELTAGILCDGLLRDFDELAALGLPVWCRGEAVRWGGDSVVPHRANTPVEAFAVTVVPGDWVYADRAGGVVVPAADLVAVVDEAERVVAEDAAALARLPRR